MSDNDSYTETTTEPAGVDSVSESSTQGFFSRLGNSLMGVLFGFLLLIASIVLLFWNESRSVTTARSLTEGRGQTITVDAGRPLPENEGKLIHLSATLASAAGTADTEFGIKSTSVKLVRTVEMYQWEEKEESSTSSNLGGSQTTTKTYRYNKVWSEKAIDSGRFKSQEGHRNPQKPVENRTVTATDGKLGGFSLPAEMVRELDATQAVDPSPDAAARLSQAYRRPVSVVNGAYYAGRDPGNPQVGDLRITFTAVPMGPATAIGRQTGSSLGPFQTKAGDKLETIRPGTLSIAQIYGELEQENAFLTWILRAVGTIMMLAGFSMLMGPLNVLADIIPILGSIVSAGTGTVAFVLTLIVAPVTIAVAWFAVRPLMSIAIIAVGVGAAFGLKKLMPAKRAPAAAGPAGGIVPPGAARPGA